MSDETSADGRSADELVCRAGTDSTAFAALFDLYYPRAFKYVIRRLYDREAAEDVTSEVFLNVARQIKRFEGKTETDFRCWLFRIATNAVAAHLRQSHRRKKLLTAAVRDGRLPTSVNAANTADEQLTLDWPAVAQELATFGEREQSIVSLRFFAALSHDEIAQVLGMTPGAVRTALCRTLEALRTRFNQMTPADRVPDRRTKG
jgi:RNA polymerase sigma-70 factor (ECF subfamily)